MQVAGARLEAQSAPPMLEEPLEDLGWLTLPDTDEEEESVEVRSPFVAAARHATDAEALDPVGMLFPSKFPTSRLIYHICSILILQTCLTHIWQPKKQAINTLSNIMISSFITTSQQLSLLDSNEAFLCFCIGGTSTAYVFTALHQ